MYQTNHKGIAYYDVARMMYVALGAGERGGEGGAGGAAAAHHRHELRGLVQLAADAGGCGQRVRQVGRGDVGGVGAWEERVGGGTARRGERQSRIRGRGGRVRRLRISHNERVYRVGARGE